MAQFRATYSTDYLFVQWSFILIFLRELEPKAQEGQGGDAGDRDAAPESATVSRIHGDRA